MQPQNKNQNIDITGVGRRKIARSFRLSVLAALVISLVYVTSVVWQSDLAMAQGATETTLGAILSDDQEVPPVAVASAAKGEGTVTVSADQTTINYAFTLTGPFTGAPQQAHIHVGPPGVSGPIIFLLCNSDPAAPATIQDCPLVERGEINGALTAAAFMPRPEVGVATFADAIAALNRGDAYINVHTPDNSTGEIRGQIGPVGLGAILTSAAEVPPVTTPSPATGTFTVAITPDHAAIDYTLDLKGMFTGEPQQAHIHVGPVDGMGPVIFFLCSSMPGAPAGVQPCPPATGDVISGSLTAAELVPAADIATFADAVDALISGGAYVNVHTPANAPGEIRGQIGLAFHADLDSAAEVPPVTTPSSATGTALAVLNQDHSQIGYAATLTGPFTGAPQQAHIHAGTADAMGPVIFFLCNSNPAAPASIPDCPPVNGGVIIGSLTATELVPVPGIATFADAVGALLRSETYVNVHTPANGSGEIRGQLQPVQPEPALEVSFALDIQPIFNANCSCHLFGAPADLSLAEGQSYANLVNVPSFQIPAFHRVQPGEPNRSYLFMKHIGAPGIIGERMPRGNPTFFDDNPDLLELERQWILGGALNN